MKKYYDLRQSLRPFLASEAMLEETVYLLQQYPIHLGLMKPRRGVFGNYQSPMRGEPHKITLNGDLNPYAFFLTFLHEYAHLQAFAAHGLRIQAHGEEWKQAFRKLGYAALAKGLFPDDIRAALENYFLTTPASSARDPHLMKALAKYDKNNKGQFLEELALGDRFVYAGRVFQKGEKRRKNYLCVAVADGALLAFSPIARVMKA